MMDGTIRETCDNAGNLKVVYDKPRRNTVKVLLLMDSGGSMDYYSRMCSALFFRRCNSRKSFQGFAGVHFITASIPESSRTLACTPNSAIPTEWILQNISSEYKVIIVGDAQMDPYELMEGSWLVAATKHATAPPVLSGSSASRKNTPISSG